MSDFLHNTFGDEFFGEDFLRMGDEYIMGDIYSSDRDTASSDNDVFDIDSFDIGST